MHQQPPQTPLLASTSAAKSSQVSGVSRDVVYWVSAEVTYLFSSRSPPGRAHGDGEGLPFGVVNVMARLATRRHGGQVVYRCCSERLRPGVGPRSSPSGGCRPR